jgi:beta-glucosidase
VATAKHFAVHSGPEADRHRDDIHPSRHDLEDTYLPAFKALVTRAKVESVMCAYNAVDGVPACANTALLADRLRRDWGFPATWSRTARPSPTSSCRPRTAM